MGKPFIVSGVEIANPPCNSPLCRECDPARAQLRRLGERKLKQQLRARFALGTLRRDGGKR